MPGRPSLTEYVLRRLVDPANAGPVLAAAVVVYYVVAALANDELSSLPEQHLMTRLALLSGVFILIGWFAGARLMAEGRLPTRAVARLLLTVSVACFAAFVAVTALTAPSLPLLAALMGQDPADIALAREQFLKAREGPLIALVYLNAALTFTLVPYAMCLGFIKKQKAAWLLLALFLGYSVLFLEKAFFVRVFAPLAALLVVTRNRQVRLSWLLVLALALLAVNIALSGFADERGVLGFLVFRVIEIPAKTAIDTLAFWSEYWGGEYLHGATNLVFSNLLSLERVHLERMVFEYQFGPYESGTASANAVFFADAFVNFGYAGVVLSSVLVGAVLAFVGRSSDLALRCLAPLIMYSVFFASFFSVLFGNGLLAFLLIRPLWIGRDRAHGGPMPVPLQRGIAK